MKQSKGIKQNWTVTENFDICFCVIFDWYYQRINFWKGGLALGSVSTQFWDVSNIFWLSVILSFKSFIYSWRSLYTMFFVLDIK